MSGLTTTVHSMPGRVTGADLALRCDLAMRRAAAAASARTLPACGPFARGVQAGGGNRPRTPSALLDSEPGGIGPALVRALLHGRPDKFE